jgi:methionyl-tRNA formyltransferase
MRIIVNGQQAFGQAVLEALLGSDHEVIAVYCRPDQDGKPPDGIAVAARAAGVPVYQPKSFHDPAVEEGFLRLDADLCVMAYVTLHVPRSVLEMPKNGTIQYHPSLLPRHRGPSSINWPIIRGETATGLTIFWPDEGLDEGPILLQRDVEIREDDTLGSLYFQRLFPMGIQAIVDAVELVASGEAPRIEQDHALATYEGWCRDDDARIDWRAPGRSVWDLVRGTDPQPGAWATLASRRVKLYDGAWSPVAVDAPPGTIVDKDGDRLIVATRGGQVSIGRVRVDGSREKVPAAGAGFGPGDRFG